VKKGELCSVRVEAVTEALLYPGGVTHRDSKYLYAACGKREVGEGGGKLCVRGGAEDMALAGLNRKAKSGEEGRESGERSSNMIRWP
jgi:hypothetical protein